MTRTASPFLVAYVGLVTVFLLGPIAVAIVLSFSNVSQLVFPPPGLSFEWYVVAWDNRKFVDGFVVSTIIATISSAMAGVAGTLAGISINNYRFFGRSAVQSLVIMPLIIPAVVIGLGLLQTLGAGRHTARYPCCLARPQHHRHPLCRLPGSGRPVGLRYPPRTRGAVAGGVAFQDIC